MIERVIRSRRRLPWARLRRWHALVIGSLVLAALAAPAIAGTKVPPRPVDDQGRAQYRTVRLLGAGPEQLRKLTLLGFDLEGRAPGAIVAHVTDEDLRKLDALGVAWEEIPRTPEALAETESAETERAPAAYHTYDSLTSELQQVVADHPDIARLSSAGTSVQGRELWWLLISDNPDMAEDEPGFKYMATMHGDEKVGTENCLRLIHLLTDGYGSDPRLTRLVDEVEIWIMPLMNPDGHTLGQRYNANGADLNRDFPDRIDDPLNTPDGRQPETQHVMDWQAQHATVLSANFHGGALVTNYPYDNNENHQAVYTATPDDDIVREVSLEYSEDNLPMYYGAWPQGVTNGAAWYVVIGGMQDWNYDYHGDIEMTIEISDVKTPSATTLDTFWDENRESMVSYMERALTGARGIVTDAESGAPLAARLEIGGRGVGFFTDPAVGDFHRVMPAGTFDLIVSAPGYQSETAAFTVIDSEADAVRVDVALQPLPTRLEQVGSRVDQDDGADGFLDPGESGRLAVALANEGRAASGITGTLRSLTPHGTPSGLGEWPPLGPGAQAESQTPHLGLDVAPATPAGHKLGFVLDWQTTEGAEGTTSAFFVPLGAPLESQQTASDTPRAIKDFEAVESTIVVEEDLELSEVNVRVDLTHTYVGDLTLTLVAPDGTQVRLHDRSGGSTDDIHTWYDNDTSPRDSLDALVGKSSAGSWLLRVTDDAGGDVGTLEGWTLQRFGRPWEDPVAEVLLRDVSRTGSGDVTLDWWPVGSATSYRVYRSEDPSAMGQFVDVTGEDADTADTSFVDTAPGSLLLWIVVAEGHTGPGIWGHFGQ